MFRPLAELGSVLNQTAPPCQIPHTGIACGRPSRRVVQIQ